MLLRPVSRNTTWHSPCSVHCSAYHLLALPPIAQTYLFRPGQTKNDIHIYWSVSAAVLQFQVKPA